MALLLVVAAPRAESAPSPGADERITHDVKRIAHFGIRTAGSPAERRVATMVARDLRALGYRVTTQRVALPGGGASTSVVARGSAPARRLVTAHLDGMPGTLAANDNASGTAALLELARRLRGQPVMLVALGAEERGWTGSSIHLGAARLAAGMSRTERARIRIGVNLDMLGLGAPLRVRSLGGAPNRSARVALGAARAAGVAAVFQADPSGLSDHAELTRAGMPMVWLYRPDPACWHRSCDRPSRLVPADLASAADVAERTVRRGVVLARLPLRPGG